MMALYGVLTVGVFLLAGSAEGKCTLCETECELPFDGNKMEISVFKTVIPLFAYDCLFLQKVNVRYPGLNIREVTIDDIVNGAHEDRWFPVVSDALAGEDPNLEVMDLDHPWTRALSHRLMRLPPTIINGLRPKFVNKASDGGILSFPRLSNMIVPYFRADMFETHGVEYKTDSWASWTASLKALQQKVRSSAAGPADFLALHFRVDGDTRQKTGLMAGFFSGNDAGSLVDENGTVTANNPRALETLEMMLDWQATILSTDAYTVADPMQLLKDGVVAVAFLPLSRNLELRRDWANKIEMSPMPGVTGRGIQDGTEVAVSQHTRLKNLSIEITEQVARSHLMWTYDTRNPEAQENTMEATFQNQTGYIYFCIRDPLLCIGRLNFAGPFWDEPYVSRAHGCKESFDRCESRIASAWEKLFDRRAPPAEVLASIESNINILLGNWAPSADGGGTALTTERIALIVTVVLCSIVLVALCAIMYNKISGLRKTKGCTIPISAFLGASVLVLFCVIQVVAITEWNRALREVSEDLGSSLQMESLATIQLRVYAEAQLRVQDPLLTFSQMSTYVKATFTGFIPDMDLDTRSFLLLIDLTDSSAPQVIVSSDSVRQVENVVLTQPYSEDVSPWVKAALAAGGAGALSGVVDTTQIFKVEIGGDVVLINFQAVWAGDGARNISFLVVYFVPEVVIFEEANESLERAIDISFLLTVVGVMALVILATFITLPLISLANDMEEVRAMRIDDIRLKTPSLLTELGSLTVGFNAMRDMLIEFKSFMPKTLFSNDENEFTDHSDENTSRESYDQSVPSESGNHTNTPSAGRTSQSSHLVQRRKGPQMQVGLGAISQVRGTLLVVSLLDGGADIEGFETFLSVIEKCITGGGVLHSFNTMKPGELVVSYGVAGQNTSARVSSEKAANAALEIVHIARDVTAAFAALTIRVNAGNIGNKKTRGFALFGSNMLHVPSFVESSYNLASTLDRSVIVCNSEFTKLPGYDFRIVDALNPRGNQLPVQELVGRSAIEAQEWMYQLQAMELNQPTEAYHAFLTDYMKYKATVPADLEELLAASAEEPESNVIRSLRDLLDSTRMLPDLPLSSLIDRYCDSGCAGSDGPHGHETARD